MLLREATLEDFAFVEEHTAFPDHYQKEPTQTVFSVALEQDGDVCAVGYLVLITGTCGWVGCDITTFAEHHKIEMIRTMRTWIDTQAVELGLTRLQAWIDKDRPEAIRLVEHLGFNEESMMPNFIDEGKDALLYVKFYGFCDDKNDKRE
jgi:hypothetical protein